MIRLIILFMFASLTSASAQAVFGTLSGPYGSATNPATSCAANPHQLQFMSQPPHAMFSWAQPWADKDGNTVNNERYDLVALDV